MNESRSTVRNRGRTLVALLLLATLLLSPLAVTAQQPAPSVSAQIANSSVLEPEAPYAPYAKYDQPVRYFLQQVAGSNVPNDYALVYDRPTNPATLSDVLPDPTGELPNLQTHDGGDDEVASVPGSFPSSILLGVPTTSFRIPSSLAPLQSAHLLAASITVYASCISGQDPLTGENQIGLLGGLQADIVRLDSNGNRIDESTANGFQPYGRAFLDDTLGGLPSPLASFGAPGLLLTDNIYPLTGTIESFTNSGAALDAATPGRINAGQQFQLEISNPNLDGIDCFVVFGSAEYPSQITFQTDGGRMSVWSEDRTSFANNDGLPTQSLPSAGGSTNQERRFVAQTVFTTAWPDLFALCDADNCLRERTLAPGGGDIRLDFRGADGTPLLYRSTMGDERDESRFAQSIGRNPSFGNANGPSEQLGDEAVRFQWDLVYPGSSTDAPDGDYLLQLVNQAWAGTELGQSVATAPVITIGAKGLEINPQDAIDREVLRGQSATYNVLIKNTGSQSDTVELRVSAPGGGYTASVTPRFLTLAAGQSLPAQVTISTPSLTGAMTSSLVTLTAISSFGDEVSPVTQALRVSLTDEVRRGVDLRSPLLTFEVPAGIEKLLPGVTITNTGTQAETFILSRQIPTQFGAWVVTTGAPSYTLTPGESRDIELTVVASQAAAGGQQVPIALTATRLGDATVQDALTITAVVDIVVDLLLSSGDQNIQWRAIGDECTGLDPIVGLICTSSSYTYNSADDLADTQGFLRFDLENTGSRTETYDLSASWVRGGFRPNTGTCSSDPVNSVLKWEAWAAVLDPATSNFGSLANTVGDRDHVVSQRLDGRGTSEVPMNGLSTLTIPAGETRTIVTSIGYDGPEDDGGCSFLFRASVWGFEMDVAPRTDPTAVKSIRFDMDTLVSAAESEERPGTYLNAVQEVDLEGYQTEIVNGRLDISGQAGSDATQRVVVSNRGNQKDDITLTLPADQPGFSSRLILVNAITDGSCSLSANNRVLTCVDMGVQDFVLVDVVTSIAANTPVGEFQQLILRAQSVRDRGAFTDLPVLTQVAGDFVFRGQSLLATRNVVAGETVRLPFGILNDGTEDDSYTLNIQTGSSNYLPVVDQGEIFVPAGERAFRFLQITVPPGATLGEQTTFTVGMTSVETGATASAVFRTTVVNAAAFSAKQTPDVGIIPISNTVNVELEIRASTGDAAGATVAAVGSSLPPGYVLSIGQPGASTQDGSVTVSKVPIQLTAPSGEIRNSRLAPQVAVTLDGVTRTTSLSFSFEDDFGLSIAPIESSIAPIIPGGENVFTYRVSNFGLSADRVVVDLVGIPTGWQATVDPKEFNLGPLEAREVAVTLRAPATFDRNQPLDFNIIASSLLDDAVQAVFNQAIVSGSFAASLTTGNLTLPAMAPGDVVTRTVRLENTGNLEDTYRLAATLVGGFQSSALEVQLTNEDLTLNPGQARNLTMTIRATQDLFSENQYAFNVTLQSTNALPGEVDQSLGFQFKALRFVGHDVDGDGTQEFFVDRNQDTTDGLEEFREIMGSVGLPTRSLDMTQFLSQAGIERNTVTRTIPGTNETEEVLLLEIDADNDGRLDFFLDSTQDDIIDSYADPDSGVYTQVRFLKDVTGDAVVDYLLDTSGDGNLNVAYDPALGRFIPLIQRNLDNDGIPDYFVDLNGNGVLDANETVLYGATGDLRTIQRIDVNGDGRLDQVLDRDGDGLPDGFIVDGETVVRDIELRDMNNDGTADWVFDSDGDGRNDRYYDPVAKQTFEINQTGVFLQSLLDYWYVGVLFGFVLVLFGVLLLVTRK